MNFCTVVLSHFTGKCVIKILEEIIFTDKRKICFTTFTKVIWLGENLVKLGVRLPCSLTNQGVLIWFSDLCAQDRPTCFPILRYQHQWKLTLKAVP